MMGWFGKKATERIIEGTGSWIDEQQLTKEEQLKYKIALFNTEGFKIVQRIIVTWVMYVWAGCALNLCIAFWIGVSLDNWTPIDKLIDLVQTPFIWLPCGGVFSLYLTGGIPFLKKKK